jgi:hypothetical protein
MSGKAGWHDSPSAGMAGRFIVAVVLMLFAVSAMAEHEADHRYHVRGYVLSADKRPLEAARITIRDGGRIIGTGRTSGAGYYAIELHLHDEDIGRTFSVRTGEHEALIRMQAEHGNKTTARVHHVNFVDGEVIETNLSWSVPTWAYFAAAPLLLLLPYFTGAIRRKVRKLRSADAPDDPGRGKKRRDKRRR